MSRPARLLTRAIIAVSLGVCPVTAQDITWPPPGVLKPGGAVTIPRLIRQVQASYTGTAIRARIQGVVILACVVEKDGSVGEIRVARSLDAVHGLDDQAIRALKQWTFAPATKDGAAVRVVINVELSFTLRDGPPPPTLAWPEGFDQPAPSVADVAWTEEVVEVSGLRIRVSSPAGWTVLKSRMANEMLAIAKNGSFSRIGFARPQTASFSLDRPLPPAELKAVTSRMQDSGVAQGLALESLGYGQARAAAHLWAWHAWKSPMARTRDTQPSAVSGLMNEMYENVRLWTFQATAGGQAIAIFCMAAVPRNVPDADKTAHLQREAAEFGAILRRISIEVR